MNKNRFDWKHTIKMNTLFLKVVGLWPEGDEGYKLCVYSVYALCANVIVNINNIVQVVNIFYVYTNLQTLAASIYIIFTQLLATFKTCYYALNVKTVQKLMRNLEIDEFQPRSSLQEIMLESTLSMWMLMYTVFFIAVSSSVFGLCIFPILDGSFREFRFPFLAWYPYNTDISPVYELTYVHQVVSIWFLAIANLNIDAFLAALMMYIESQCEILCSDLKCIKSGEYSHEIVRCILHHKLIINFAKTSDSFTSVMALGQFFTSTASLALTLFQLTVADPLSTESFFYIFFVGAIIMQIFMYCWFGNEVELGDREFQPKNDYQKQLAEPTLNSWKIIYRAFFAIVIIALFLLCAFPIVDGTHREFRLPFWAWYPYNTKTSPNYEVTYLYQVVSFWMLSITILNIDTLITALMMYAVTQCDILSDNLKNIKNDEMRHFNKELNSHINHHKEIIRFAYNSNTFFNGIVLGQFFTSATALVLALFQLTLVTPLSSEFISLLFYVSSMTMQVFLYCWFGNEVETRVLAHGRRIGYVRHVDNTAQQNICKVIVSKADS
ncbi:hypothetical protein Zmor_007648 [Zophobas morio]|uniref:Odorant receptor n=1 Tax=Zophobas morio TaxID=2755281 RepID=A0AA38MPL3_9CUCU|nr:hypothetical protein Zmor_007648 [Zophobas morio]